jgi:hypothetical protein
MKCSMKFGMIAAGIYFATLPGMTCAAERDANLDMPTAASFYTDHFQLLRSRSFIDSKSFNPTAHLLAANEPGMVQGLATTSINEAATPATAFRPPLMSGRKAHQYLGLGTVMMAGLTMMAAPDDGSSENHTQQSPRQTSGTTHTRLARATAAMAAATVMTGLVVHWNDIQWEDPFTDPDKLHARLGTAGALMMIYAVNKSAHSTVPTNHAGIAELGALAMIVAIKLTW